MPTSRSGLALTAPSPSIVRLIQEHLAEKLGVPADAVLPHERFRRLGVDSLAATSMLAELGARLGRNLSPTLAWQFPTPADLGRHLEGKGGTGGPPLEAIHGVEQEPIAIVGMACRFPGAPDPGSFWELLRCGIDAIREVPADRWNIDALYDENPSAPGKMATRWGGWLDDVAGFDAAFFGVSPREAAQIDPQQRLMLELAWESLEDAGLPPHALKDTRTGVFFGAMWMDYARVPGATADRIEQHTATGQDLSIIPARVSYTLGLRGPSIAVNTACSSSLVAVHLARQSLLRGESRLALAGAVNLILSPESTIAMTKFGAMAPDGRSKAFDARANGYVRGEGGGVLALKRLSDAIADGDRIYCTLRGSALNNDGFSNGLTAPSPAAQEAVIRDAIADARVAPSDVQYVEAHGTGTMLGDPIEAGALGAVLGDGRPRERALRVGSVKTNIGHLEAAAGMAGLIKVALAMHHGALPPSLHFQKPNPHIDFDGLRIRVQSTLEAWEPESGRRLAGVSSFGFGGTNAHVVVEGVEPDVARPVGKLAWLFTGQGAQTVGMGQGLHQDWPAFRAALDAAFAALDPHLARPLREVMWAAPGTEDAAQLHQTAYTQPALFAIEWALAALWRSWGVEPDFVTGHSIGEIAAACVAGVFALGDAARLVCARGRLMQALPPGGAMIAIEATELEVAAALGPHAGVVSVAAVNGPESVVLAGAEEPVEAIAATLAERGVSGRRLRVSHAFHSPSMDPMLAAFRREAETIQYSAPSLPLVSTLTGALAGAEIATPEYWVRHAREGVRFAAAVKSLHDAGATMFLEIGPKATLLGLVDGVLPDARPTLLPSLRPGQPEAEGAEESLAELFASKRPIDMKRLLASGDGPRGHRLPVLAVGATSGRSARAELVVLSAKTPAALGAYARRLAEHLGSHGGANADANLPDVAYSLLTTRSSLEHRVALAVPTREALVEALLVVGAGEGSSAEEPPFDVSSGSAPKVAFVFPGQGSQWLGMGRELLAQEPAFRASLARSDRAIASEAGWSVLEELSAPAETSRLGRLEIVQPVLFAVEVALADLWRSWGVEPQAVVGHSMGEVAAACVSGALSVEDGAAVICRRSGLLTRLSGQGEMALVELSHEQAQGELAGFEDRLSVAVSNGRRSTVISGEPAAMATVLGRLESRGIFCRRVNVDFASHSPQVEPVLGELTAKLAGLSPGATQVAFRSTVRGKELSGSELTGGYWSENLRAPVRFGETIESLVSEGFTLFVEMSPHPMLVSSVEEIQRGSSSLGVSVGSLRREQPERLTMLASLGALHVHGHPLDATRLFPSGGRRVRLPTYAWQRERHWLEAPSPEAKGRDRLGGHPLLGPSTRLSSPVGTWLWEAPIDLQRLAWLTDHRVQGAAVLPAAAYLEMALAVGHELAPGTPIAIAGVEITQVLAVPDTGSVVVQVVASEEASGVWRVQVASRVPEDASATWSTHARVRVRRVETEPTLAPMDLASWRQRFGEPVDIAALYTRFASAGLEYGPAFRGIRELRRNATDGLAQIALPPTVGSARTGGPWWIHPSLLDACLQTMESLLLSDGSNATWLPVGVDSLRVPARVSGALGCLVTLRAGASSAPDRRVADLVIFDEAGARVAEIVGLTMRRVADASTSQRPEDEWLLGHRWEPRALPLPRVTAGRWLLVGDGAALGQKLGRTLRDAGHAVFHAVALGSTEPSDRAVDDTNPQALRALLNEAFGGQAPSAIVHLRSLEKGDDPDPLEASLARGCDGALALVKATAGMSWRDPPRLWVVTRGAQSVGAGEDDVSFLQAPVLGLARVIAMEHGELRCARVDLDARAPEGEVRDLCAELLADADEDEVAWRGGTRRTLRLVRVLPEPVPAATLERASGRPFGLRIAAPGVLDGLELARLPRRAPGPGEVEIEVEAAGINFRDVLLSLGVIPDEHLPEDPAREDGASAAAAPRPVQPGVECAGRIIALGPGVTGLAVGDAAIAFARRGAMASHVTTPASLVARRPLALSPAQGASVPVVYLTAWYALEKVARLRRGERVLIHAATGGVGLAAVQWAQHVGAEIHATAGTPEKSALLESMGVAFVSDSRSDRFVAEVMANTRGEGVDVVLNSLSGDLIAKSFGLLRPFGRFVELGKRDYYADSALGLRPFVKGLSFSLVDLHGMMVERPAWVGDLLSELLGHFESGVFSPPKVETFPIGSVQEAFRKMAQGHHTGKLAVTLGPAEREQAMIRVLSQEGEGGAAIRDDGTYLVTGGLGGLGLSVAGWLARRGARHIVLAGRSEVTSETQRSAVAALEAVGAVVTVARVDVAKRAALAAVLAAIPADRPLRGVVHAAGLLDDGMLLDQTPARLRRVTDPKVLGAWNLHTLTRESKLDFFVLYSSINGLLGFPAQGNYAAANVFLDALAHHRRARGLPATSIDWGIFADVGLAAAQGNRGQRIEGRGMRALTPDEGIAALERVLAWNPAQVAVARFDVQQWVEFFPGAAGSSTLSALRDERDEETAAKRPAGDAELLARLAAADPESRARLVEGALREQVAKVLRIRPETIGREAPLAKLGMDSLMGLELRNRLEGLLGIRLPAGALWAYPTLAALSAKLAANEGGAAEPEPAIATAPPPIDAPAGDVAGMESTDLMSFLDTLLERENRGPK